MRKTTLAIALCFFCITSYGQLKKVDEIKKSLETTNKDTVAWTYGGVFNIGMNEGVLHNWAAGGELASFTVNSIFSGHLDHLYHTDIWSNNLDATYGLNYAYSSAFIPHKTDDRIDFTSKYGKRIDKTKYSYFTGLFNFKSQFTKAYDYTQPNWSQTSTSRFLSPAYFTTALGYEYRKGSDISLFFSPLAGRLTLVDKEYTTRTPDGAFGVAHNKTQKYEFGAYFSGRYLFNISKNIIYKTRVDLYSNYLAKNTKDSVGNIVSRDNPGNISVLFDNLFVYKCSRHINMTLGATFSYDNSIPYVKPNINTPETPPVGELGWVQMKQIFTFGLEYKF